MKIKQQILAESLNQQFFKDNESYKSIQNDLPHYQYLTKSATHETKGVESLLDIGNGGLFIYPISQIPEVTAIDIFIEADFKKRYPLVEWLQMSALDIKIKKLFDAVIAINTLHHIIGDSVEATYGNLDRIMEQVNRVVSENGKFILLESTVPKWFLCIYKLIFQFLLAIWPLRHPPTFQFHYAEITAAAEKAGFQLEELSWIPKVGDILQFGVRIRGCLSPVQVGKFVFTKKK